MGFTNVMRYPDGYLGWLKAHCEEPPEAPQSTYQVGTLFPAMKLHVLDGKTDRSYLQLPNDSNTLELHDIKSRNLMLIVFNTLCYQCGIGLQRLDIFVRNSMNANLPDTKVIAIASGNGAHQTRRFRHQKQLSFPLFSDPDRNLFRELKLSSLPVAYLLQKNSSGQYFIADNDVGIFTEEATIYPALEARAKAATALSQQQEPPKTQPQAQQYPVK